MSRARTLILAGALGLALIDGSHPRLVGDGGEYLVMALNLAGLHHPGVAPLNIDALHRRATAIDERLATWEIRDTTVSAPDGRRDFVHFWVYPLLAVPGIWVAQLTGVTPLAGFTILNAALLGLALWICLPRLGGALALLLFGGPIIWWIDKAHTEAFSFALLAIAFASLRDRPWWSLTAAGLASTQNPPMTLLVPLMGIVCPVATPALAKDRRFWIGLATGLALALLQPAYTYLRHGTVSLLLQTTDRHLPPPAELLVAPLDPAIGLAGNFPVFVILVVAALALLIARRHWLDAGAVVALTSGAAFLVSFTQTSNLHHGATPGMSRYALWLIPLGIPSLRLAWDLGGAVFHRSVWTAAVVSAATMTFAFHPRIDEYTAEPSPLARWLWTRHPGWNNPLPEVFVEIMNGPGERRFVPVATTQCGKVLTVGRNDGSAFPIPCYPPVMPPECRAAGALCYANRTGTHFDFVKAPGSPSTQEGFTYQPGAVWPAAALPHVRKLLTDAQWWTLEQKVQGEDIVRETHDVRVLELEGPRRLVLVLRGAGAEAYVALRPPWPMKGLMMDAVTGQTLRSLQFDGEPFSRWQFDLPAGDRLLLVWLWGT